MSYDFCHIRSVPNYNFFVLSIQACNKHVDQVMPSLMKSDTPNQAVCLSSLVVGLQTSLVVPLKTRT